MRFVVNEYNLYSPKINNEADIVCISDVHSDIEKMKQIKEILKKLKISTLLISGDLIDSTDDKRNDQLCEIMNNISSLSQTFIAMGNHDLVYFDSKRKELPSNDTSFYDSLSVINNITVFRKSLESISLNSDIQVSALNMPYEYYENKEDKDSANLMWLERFLLNNAEANTDRFNILLSHTPRGIIKDQLINQQLNYISDMNLILSGHMHAGLIPIMLRRKNGHRGLVGPHASYFPKTSYGLYENDGCSMVVSGGITKVANSNELRGLSSFANSFFASEIELIHLLPGDEHHMEQTKRVRL